VNMEKESVFKTLAVAVGVCAVCAVLVSITTIALKPQQEENKALDKKKNILLAAGLMSAKGYSLDSEGNETKERVNVNETFARLVPQVIDLTTGEVVEMEPEAIAKLDERELVKKPETRIDIVANTDIAGIKVKPLQTVIYLLKDENGETERYIFPFYGRGLWSTMYGFIALDAELNTVGNICFYDHGETPGLGGEIVNPNWQAKWSDKTAFDSQGKVAVHVVKGPVKLDSRNKQFEVDGIAGSTLTCNGVNHAVHYWLGENGFGPYIKKIKENQ